MNSGLIIPLLSSPADGWLAIRDANLSVREVYLRYVIPFALITPVCGFIGATQVGWPIAGADKLFMTSDSAFRIAVLSFLAILVAIMMIGKLVQWMGQTYEAKQPLSRCVSLAVFCITPLLLIGFATLYPPLWFIYLLGFSTGIQRIFALHRRADHDGYFQGPWLPVFKRDPYGGINRTGWFAGGHGEYVEFWAGARFCLLSQGH